MTDFLLVRHAVTEENLTHRMIGVTNPPLHPWGYDQALHLATYLRDVPLKRIVASPLTRAFETARLISREHPHIQVETQAELTEVHLGIVEGMSSFVAYERHKPWMDQALLEDTPDFAFPGGESRIHAEERIRSLLEKLAHETPIGLVCVVTHGGVLGLWRAALEGKPLGSFRKFQPSHASISHIRIKPRCTPEILDWSIELHLPLTLQHTIQNARRRQP